MMRFATYSDKVIMNMITKIGFNSLCPSMGGGGASNYQFHHSLFSPMCMCFRHACTTIVQFRGQNVSPGAITAQDYSLACVACIFSILSMKEQNHKCFTSLPH